MSDGGAMSAAQSHLIAEQSKGGDGGGPQEKGGFFQVLGSGLTGAGQYLSNFMGLTSAFSQMGAQAMGMLSRIEFGSYCGPLWDSITGVFKANGSSPAHEADNSSKSPTQTPAMDVAQSQQRDGVGPG